MDKKRAAFLVGTVATVVATSFTWTDEELTEACAPMPEWTPAELRGEVRSVAAWLRRFADALDRSTR